MYGQLGWGGEAPQGQGWHLTYLYLLSQQLCSTLPTRVLLQFIQG